MVNLGPPWGSGPGLGVWSGLPEQVVEFGLDIDVVAFLPGRNDLVGPLEEGRHGLSWRFEVCLAERGRQRDVQHRALGVSSSDHLQAIGFGAGLGRGPDLHVALALPRLDPRGQQVPGEDPLNWLISAHMERHAHRVGVAAAVVQTGHKRDNRLLWDDKPETQFGRDRGAAASVHVLPTPYLADGQTPELCL